jgi:putative phosphoesterase
VRIGLVSDVHANLPALETVVAHAQAQGCEVFWNLGDLVGYGPFPQETVKFLRKLPEMSVLGNYDRKVLSVPKKEKRWRKTKHPLKFQAFEWAYGSLSKKSRNFLKNLPFERRVEFGKVGIYLSHGSPESDAEVILPSTSTERLRHLAGLAGAPLILCGHSHQPFAFEFERWWFINPGSVGRPLDGDPRASYAILDADERSWSILHYRLEYDVSRVVEQIRLRGLPPEFARMLEMGLDLGEVEKSEI